MSLNKGPKGTEVNTVGNPLARQHELLNDEPAVAVTATQEFDDFPFNSSDHEEQSEHSSDHEEQSEHSLDSSANSSPAESGDELDDEEEIEEVKAEEALEVVAQENKLAVPTDTATNDIDELISDKIAGKSAKSMKVAVEAAAAQANAEAERKEVADKIVVKPTEVKDDGSLEKPAGKASKLGVRIMPIVAAIEAKLGTHFFTHKAAGEKSSEKGTEKSDADAVKSDEIFAVGKNVKRKIESGIASVVAAFEPKATGDEVQVTEQSKAMLLQFKGNKAEAKATSTVAPVRDISEKAIARFNK